MSTPASRLNRIGHGWPNWTTWLVHIGLTALAALATWVAVQLIGSLATGALWAAVLYTNRELGQPERSVRDVIGPWLVVIGHAMYFVWRSQ